MTKSLIIAEKPSVATDLSKTLAKAPGQTKFEKVTAGKESFFENETTIISSAVGHLLELCMPNLPNGKKPSWKMESLPIIPEKFELEPVDRTKTRFNLLKKLIKRKDVGTIINACDAGREGELIFRYLIEAIGVEKPVKRMWMQSMTTGAIMKAYEDMRDGEEMQPLSDAAHCRSESDWLMGINGTRALTAFNSRHGGFNKTPVGRVQTPTLSILVEREKAIQAFVSEPYWEVHGEFSVAAGGYAGRWFDPNFKKVETKPHARQERIWDKETAEAIVARCIGKPGRIEETKKPTKQGVPLLYDLTSLQREANGRFGFSARRTLQIAQALYEKYKVLTYPRTDSRYLPEDYLDTVKETLGTLAGAPDAGAGGFPAELKTHADAALNEYGVKPNKRIFNSAKVSDHFAIIPTGQIPKGLDETAAKLFKLVTQRFIAAFYPSAEFEVTARTTIIGDDHFKTDGKILVKPGWLAVYGKTSTTPAEGESDDAKNLVPVAPGEDAKTDEVRSEDKATRPPPHFNEATLLSTMEGAGKLVEDEELAEAMSERGLGTPATRASIIEGLLFEKYVAREGRDLYASPKAINLIDQVKAIGVEAFTSPELTGEWEYKLKQMEQGLLSREDFMREIKDTTVTVVNKTRAHMEKVVSQVFPDLKTTCPQCGSTPLAQTDAHYACTNPECKFRIVKVISSRPIPPDEAKDLIEKRFLGPLTGFRSRFGADFGASLELIEEKGKFKTNFIFPQDERDAEEVRNLKPEDKFFDHPEGTIYSTPTAWALLREGEETFDKKIRLPKELCKIEIPEGQALKFFKDGKTDVIENFISKKGRPFSASLNLDPEGKRGAIRWEFPPRAAKKKAAKKKAAKKKAASES